MANKQQRKSWEVKDEEIHAELAEMMELTQQEKDLLIDLQDVAEEQSDAMTDDFYDRLMSHENTAEYFEDIEMERQHEFIADWFVDLFNGSYDAEYVAERLEIGHIHVRIGLPVRYPLSMIDVIMQHGEEVVAESADPEKAKDAFQKVMSLDIAVFNQAYEDRQLEHLADLVGGERLARRLLQGSSEE
jgi:hypothetical protein